jgi:ribosome-associated protein
MCEDMALLAPAQIEKLNLPEEIEAAILAAAKMPFKAARKRQLKFITGLVRKIGVFSNKALKYLNKSRDDLIGFSRLISFL